jgi:hypothetical protein
MRAVFFIIVSVFFWCNVALAETSNNSGIAKTTSSNFIEQVLINENTSRAQINLYTQSLEQSLSELKKKQPKFKSEQDFLEHVFYKIHKKHLKKYEAYKSFNSLLENGKYGCLTGTALYAVLLYKLGFDYRIVETNYHIYLLATTEEGEILMESTDAFNGFVSNPKEIKERIKVSLEEQVAEVNEYQYTLNIYNQINLTELIGLQYYNQAVNSYNHQNISESLYQLNEAAKYYPSPRIVELLGVINQTLNNSVGTYLKEYQVLNALVIN